MNKVYVQVDPQKMQEFKDVIRSIGLRTSPFPLQDDMIYYCRSMTREGNIGGNSSPTNSSPLFQEIPLIVFEWGNKAHG